MSRAGNSTVQAGCVVVAVAFLAYLPAVFHSFVEWDDVTVIVGNPVFNPVSWQTVGYYWCHIGENLYIPVTYTLWAALARMGELNTPDVIGSRFNPYVFHLASVMLHAAAATAVYLLLLRMVRSSWPAAVGALLYALHPLQVEAVAFIGSMNTPLAAALGLWAVWFYLRSGDSDEAGPASIEPTGTRAGTFHFARWCRPNYFLATALLVLAMLSKPTVVMLPIVALLLDIAGNPRHWRDQFIAVLPWFALSAACAVCARYFQRGASVPVTTPWNHLLIAADAGFFYLHKLVFPWPLTIDYGRNPQSLADHGRMGAFCLAVILSILIAIDLIACRIRTAYRHLPVLCILVAIVGLLPNSGLVSFDFQYLSTVADRYVYLAMLGPALWVAMTANWLTTRSRTIRLIGTGILLLVLTVLTVLTEQQIQTWSDGTTLFRHAIAINPNSWMSYENLAYIESESDPKQAMDDCRRSIAIHQDNAIAWNTLGSILMERGERAQAIEAFDRAHNLSPESTLFAINAANARKGK